jgi:hypothetical protein
MRSSVGRNLFSSFRGTTTDGSNAHFFFFWVLNLASNGTKDTMLSVC